MSLRQFVAPRIPVVSTPNDFLDTAPPVEGDSVVLEWGAASYLNFSLDIDGSTKTKFSSRFSVDPPFQKILRHGPGVDKAVDHEGNTIAESPIDADWELKDLFYVGSFIEETEESKTIGSSTTIQPIITHVDLYVQWSEIPAFGYDVIEETGIL